MKVAVIGCGLSGLAATWHLLNFKSVHVDLFDAKGVGGGASGIASGLLHPYPGEQGRRSWKAKEVLEKTLLLLQVAEKALGESVANYNGIIRLLINKEQQEIFSSHAAQFGDVDFLEDCHEQICEKRVLIRSGITIDVPLYLKGLWHACEKLGAQLHIHAVQSLQELNAYDKVIVAAGPQSFEFLECKDIGVKFVKGQLVKCLLPPHFSLSQSLIAKAYLAMNPKEESCFLGATYERDFSSEETNLVTTFEYLKKKMAPFFPEVSNLIPSECRAGIRVMNCHQYLPLVKQLKNERYWFIGAMGSRGLLYHAYFGELLAALIL